MGGAGLHGVAFSWKSMVDACLRYQGLEHRSRGRLTPTDTDGIGRVDATLTPPAPVTNLPGTGQSEQGLGGRSSRD